MRWIQVLGVCALTCAAVSTTRGVTFANWSSTNAAILGPYSVKFNSTVQGSLALDSADLSTSDFSAAPGSATQQILDYAVSDDWSASFSDTVPQLLLDVKFWRGTQAGAPPPTINYTFNQPFTILSGLAGSTSSGNTLSLPDDNTSGFFDGILEFTNVSTLSITDNSDPADTSSQSLTLSLLPEPAALSMIVVIGGLMLRRRGHLPD
ncbi:MAG TPA: hypothetical protein VGF52_02395 [Tepidisphaeraceae bacterium]